MTTTQTTAPALNDDAVLVLLAVAGHEGAIAEYNTVSVATQARLWGVRTELIARGLIEIEDGELYVTPAAEQAAMDAETERVRAAAIARRAQR